MAWENNVKISGKVHFLKGHAEGETATGKYVQFAVRQDSVAVDGSNRRDFLVVRVYEQEARDILASKKAGDDVTVEGTLRSSSGSGINYVRCQTMV